jgi:pimeloyl-ACP methyl ester carboxylesterase
MTNHRARFGPHNPGETYVAHAIAEQLVDLGEIQMSYATVGDAASPALLLIPGQTESWWGYEAAMPLLAERFQVFAVDLRGQGRSTRTPGRYTLDNMGNDLVRFLDLVIGRPAIVSGLSSGGVLAAWLWSSRRPLAHRVKEYDPEWGRSFWTGTVAAACDHERMLRSVKVPSVLLTHHMRITDEASGFLFGAMSDQQAQRVQDLLTGAGVDVRYRSFPDVGHSMHGDRPDLYVETLFDWVASITA